jgi:hypothetical protein
VTIWEKAIIVEVRENLAEVMVEAGVQRLFLQIMGQIPQAGRTIILADLAIYPAAEGTTHLLKSKMKNRRASPAVSKISP